MQILRVLLNRYSAGTGDSVGVGGRIAKIGCNREKPSVLL